MVNAAIMTMPVEKRLEFMTVICSYCIDSEWEFVDHVIDKFNGIFLGMAFIYLYGSNSSGIIDCSILKTFNLFVILRRKERVCCL